MGNSALLGAQWQVRGLALGVRWLPSKYWPLVVAHFGISWKVLLSLVVYPSVCRWGRGGQGRKSSAVPEMHAKLPILRRIPCEIQRTRIGAGSKAQRCGGLVLRVLILPSHCGFQTLAWGLPFPAEQREGETEGGKWGQQGEQIFKQTARENRGQEEREEEKRKSFGKPYY